MFYEAELKRTPVVKFSSRSCPQSSPRSAGRQGTSADHLARAGGTRASEQTVLTAWAVGALIS
jgi:hypothetical protein